MCSRTTIAVIIIILTTLTTTIFSFHWLIRHNLLCLVEVLLAAVVFSILLSCLYFSTLVTLIFFCEFSRVRLFAYWKFRLFGCPLIKRKEYPKTLPLTGTKQKIFFLSCNQPFSLSFDIFIQSIMFSRLASRSVPISAAAVGVFAVRIYFELCNFKLTRSCRDSKLILLKMIVPIQHLLL
jgi:hypothetical protein